MIFEGTILKRGDNLFVQTSAKEVIQKVFPVYPSNDILNEGDLVEFELIPNTTELDEQVEYTARLTFKIV